jgi:zinc-ribbon domain
MFCTSCGKETPDGANACANCGALLTASAEGGAQAAPPGSFAAPPVGAASVADAPGGSPQFAFDFNRLALFDRIIGIATFVLLVSLFLPWVTGVATETIGTNTSTERFGSISGYTLHGYFWIVFVVSLAVIAFLVMKAGFATMPVRLPLPDDVLLLIATGIMFVLVLLGFLFTGYGFGASGGSAGTIGTLGYSYHVGVSRDFGAYLSLVAALVAVIPLGWPFIQSRINKQSHPGT